MGFSTIENEASRDSFKLKIKNWIPFECPSRLCKTYIQEVGIL